MKSFLSGKGSGATQAIYSLAWALSWAVLLAQTSCKSIDAKKDSLLSEAVTTEVECGTKKTYYFHWASEAVANAWIKEEGGPAESNHSQLQASSSPRYGVTNRLIKSLYRHDFGDGAVGAGIYLAYGPVDTHEFGNALLIFRFRDEKGQGLPCADWVGQEDKRKQEVARNPGASSLPLLAQYRRDDKARWFISPRAPTGSQGGEIVDFTLPQVGDAEAYVAELMGSALTVDQFLDAFARVYKPVQASNWTKGLCQGQKKNGSEIFLQEFYCRAIVKNLTTVLARAKSTNILPETRSRLAGFAGLYTEFRMNSPEVYAAVMNFDPTLACYSMAHERSISSPEEIKTLSSCRTLVGDFRFESSPDQKVWNALQNIEQVNGSLQIKTLAPFSYKVLAKLQKADTLLIEAEGSHTDCDAVMQLKKADSLGIWGSCAPQFPQLTSLDKLRFVGPATSLAGLSALERIRYFSLINTLVEDLGFLAKVKSLAELVLTNNVGLKSLQPLLKNNPFQLVEPQSSVSIREAPQLPKAEIDQLRSILKAKKIEFSYDT